MRYAVFLWFLLVMNSHAQYHINGIVKNHSNGKGLPFVSIETSDKKTVISDVNGKFLIEISKPNTTLTARYIGFETQTIAVSTEEYVTLKLLPIESIDKDAYWILNESKAQKIIQYAITREKENNPQKKLDFFEFKIYDKILVTAIPDSIPLFSENKNPENLATQKIDSTFYKFKKMMEKQHLFIAEKTSLLQHQNHKTKETVLGTQMSGFKNPIYEIIGFTIQSYFIYDPRFELFETKYVNPVSKEGLKDYHYKILDTVNLQNRNCVRIYFKNKKKINRKGLEGIIYLDAENFGIAKANFRIRSLLDITTNHEFTFLKNENIWFPAFNEFKIIKGKNEDDIKILGGTIYFEGEYEELGSKKGSDPTDYVYLYSKSHIYDVKTNTTFDIKRKWIGIEINESATTKNETFWTQNRKEKLDERGLNTYKALDSMAFKKGLESKIFLGRKIINGYLPISFFDVDLRYFLSYNNFEGFRVGIGGITNEKFSKKYRINGYSAYGIKDETFKYQIGNAFRIGKTSNSWIGLQYTDDVREIGSTNFLIDKRVFKIYDPRPINVSTFYNHKTWSSYIETKIIPKTESIWHLNHSRIEPLFDYTFFTNNTFYNRYDMTTASLSLQWNPFSTFMQTPNGKIEIDKKFPKFTFQYTQSLPEILNNDFTFSKLDLRVEFEKKFINGQKSTFLIQGGFAFGDIPLTHLYNNTPNNLDRDNLLQRITVAGKNSFETMLFNEFFSSRFVMLHLKHGFKRITLFKKIKPSLVLVSRMAWGDMEKPEQHIGLNYKTLNAGYFESGIELNQIYKGFGLAGFYRYGPNQFARLEDNIAIKLTFSLDLGF